MNKEPTVSDDGVKQSCVPPHRLGRVRHHHVHIHVLFSVLPEVGSDVLIGSSPFLVFTTGPA